MKSINKNKFNRTLKMFNSKINTRNVQYQCLRPYLNGTHEVISIQVHHMVTDDKKSIDLIKFSGASSGERRYFSYCGNNPFKTMEFVQKMLNKQSAITRFQKEWFEYRVYGQINTTIYTHKLLKGVLDKEPYLMTKKKTVKI